MRVLPAVLALVAATGCSPFTVEPGELHVPDEGFFVDISDESGMRADNFYAEPAAGTSINDHSRLAFADINGDGFDDMVMHSLFPNAQNGVPFEHLVFLNDGAGGFLDHSDDSGLRDVQAGFFAFGDIDNDGDQDVYAGLDLPTAGNSAIYLNDGQGQFELLDNSGVEAASGTAANAVFADFNGDAVLDLFVGLGGTSYLGQDLMYIGLGDGTFADESTRLAQRPSQPSNGSVTCDYDNDGDVDIFVSTYSVSTANGVNHLWENDGDGNFTEVGMERGFAAQITGNYWLSTTGDGHDPEFAGAQSAMGAIGSNGFGLDCADVNNDGYADVYLTAISHPVNSDYKRKWSDPSQLLINGGPDADYAFTNEWLDRDLPFNEGDVDGGFADIDNDGRLDLSTSREKKYEGNYSDVDQKSWFGLLRQDEDGDFESLGFDSGINDADGDSRRMKGAQNHAWSDIDHDGDVDLLVGGRDMGGGRPNFLFRNDAGSLNRWLSVELIGDGEHVTTDAFGARVTLLQGDQLQMREKRSSRGMYNSEDTRTLHLGLHEFDRGAELEVSWPDGTTAVFELGRDFGDNSRVRVAWPDVLEVVE